MQDKDKDEETSKTQLKSESLINFDESNRSIESIDSSYVKYKSVVQPSNLFDFNKNKEKISKTQVNQQKTTWKKEKNHINISINNYNIYYNNKLSTKTNENHMKKTGFEVNKRIKSRIEEMKNDLDYGEALKHKENQYKISNFHHNRYKYSINPSNNLSSEDEFLKFYNNFKSNRLKNQKNKENIKVSSVLDRLNKLELLLNSEIDCKVNENNAETTINFDYDYSNSHNNSNLYKKNDDFDLISKDEFEKMNINLNEISPLRSEK